LTEPDDGRLETDGLELASALVLANWMQASYSPIGGLGDRFELA
jgi:hypothetical protein